MQTAITITANSQTGNLAQISLSVKRLGFKLVNINMEQQPAESLDVITLTVDSQRQPVEEDFSALVAKLSNIIKVDILGQQRAVAPARSVRSVTVTEEDKATFVKTEGRKLVAAYPNISQSLTALEATMPVAARSELMMRIGTALGQWQYKKVYSGNSRMNKTVQNSLKMQSKQFGGLPVISDLISTGAKKQQSVDATDPITQLHLLLSDFLTVSIENSRFTVTDCPHCAADRTPWETDCNFIKGFMQGFMLDVADLKGATVSQRSSKAMGANACVFEVLK